MNRDNNFIVKANAGENPVNEAYLPKELISDLSIFRYPDPLAKVLRSKIADYVGYRINNVMCTNGSDEAIVLIIHLLTGPNEEVIICPPTFSMFASYITYSRARVVSIKRNKDFSLNVEKILSAITPKTKMILVDSPGNPCGTTIAENDLVKLLKKKLIVVVDEAYFEYCQESVVNLIRIYPNLIVTRTFSKWAGLAGLRVGYIVANESVIDRLLKLKLPYNVNSVAQRFASYVLDNKDLFLKRLEHIVTLREQAIQRLENFPEVKVYQSKTAYIVIKLSSKGSSEYLQRYFENDNIFVQVINQPFLERCIRVNFGSEEEIDRFCFSLKKWLQNNQVTHDISA